MSAEYVLNKEEAIYDDKAQLWTQTIYHQDGREEKKFWRQNESIYSHQFFLSGIREGECKVWWWNEDNQLRDHEFYKNGQLNGKRKVWYINGQMMLKQFYQNGNQQGKYKHWHGNGRIWIQSFFRNGKQDGESQIWNDNGTIVNHHFYGLFDENDYPRYHPNCYHFSNKKKRIILKLKNLLFPDSRSILDEFLIRDLRDMQLPLLTPRSFHWTWPV
jgi:hypothetical protein